MWYGTAAAEKETTTTTAHIVQCAYRMMHLMVVCLPAYLSLCLTVVHSVLMPTFVCVVCVLYIYTFHCFGMTL